MLLPGSRFCDNTLLLAYAQALILNISLVAVCNRHHTLEKQLCRWLLQSLDRVTGRQLRVTQELIALLLGVRRQGVTEALSSSSGKASSHAPAA